MPLPPLNPLTRRRLEEARAREHARTVERLSRADRRIEENRRLLAYLERVASIYEQRQRGG